MENGVMDGWKLQRNHDGLMDEKTVKWRDKGRRMLRRVEAVKHHFLTFCLLLLRRL